MLFCVSIHSQNTTDTCNIIHLMLWQYSACPGFTLTIVNSYISMSCIQKPFGMVSTKHYNSFWVYTMFKWYPARNVILLPLHQHGNLLMRLIHLSWVIPEMKFGLSATKWELRLRHSLMTYHLLVWPCAVVYTASHVTWTKICIK